MAYEIRLHSDKEENQIKSRELSTRNSAKNLEITQKDKKNLLKSQSASVLKKSERDSAIVSKGSGLDNV